MAYICIPYDEGAAVVSGTIRLSRKEYEKLKYLAAASNASKGTVVGWIIDRLYDEVVTFEKEKQNEDVVDYKRFKAKNV